MKNFFLRRQKKNEENHYININPCLYEVREAGVMIMLIQGHDRMSKETLVDGIAIFTEST